MARFITLAFFILISSMAYCQGFPDAQKQPRFKEMRSQHKHYARQAKRRHIKRGTAFMDFDHPLYLAEANNPVSDNRRWLGFA